MANSTLTADVIAKVALPILDNELAVLKTIHRGHEKEFSSKVNGYDVGETISIARPADFTVRDGAVASNQDVVEGKVALTVNKQKGIDFKFSSIDLTLNITDIAERVIKPAMVNLANNVAQDVFDEMYKGAYNWVGTPGETIDAFTDFTKGPERLDEMAVPQDSRNALLSPTDHWALVGANSGLFVKDAASAALRRGEIGMLGDVNTWMSQVTPTHVVGDYGGTPLMRGAAQEVTYVAAKDVWTQTFATDGWTASKNLKRGDVFTIAGVNMVNPKTKADTGILQQFVLTADVTTNASSSASTVLTVAPPMIVSGPHQTVTAAASDNAAITVVGTANASYKQNMFYHKNAMALAVVPMAMPQAAVNGARHSRNGLSVRVIPTYDGVNDISNWRLDILYARRLIDPRLVTRGSGTA